MALDKYQSMRDFERTAEPSGTDEPEISEHEARGEPRFVVQEHHATALHWDFRLERGGVLVSWALPKGVPPHPKVNNMAVHTEDHPLSYFDFAGDIPEGEYGGGKVMLWDQGTYDELKWSDREVMVVLHGERARGKYVLFKTGNDARSWMIHRMDPPEDPTRELVPRDVRPAAPEEGPLPRGDAARGWRWMPTWGGARVAITVEGGRCTAREAAGDDVTKAWKVLAPFGRAVGSLAVVFAGELVHASASSKDGGAVFLDDVLWLDGHDVSALPFATRRSRLEETGLEGPAWHVAPAFDEPAVLLEAAAAQGLPGILGVRDDAPYGPPRLVRTGDVA
ncbi:MAG TPA: DNA polymerase ligase N-terminal domain-containing protein [Acidimicrobiales bacterium]|nr:DNA polymerase ligase N-terminal domain-containing protein [Acidimicrobiales bacterium]